MTDAHAASKAKMRAIIAATKKKPTARAELQAMLDRAMSKWGEMVRMFGEVSELQNDLREKMGQEPESVLHESLEFPNWVVAEIRKAIAEVEQ